MNTFHLATIPLAEPVTIYLSAGPRPRVVGGGETIPLTAETGEETIVVRHAWQSGAPLARRGPTVTALAPALGLTDQQIDQMFIEAESLSV